jgi:hypothetical protein
VIKPEEAVSVFRKLCGDESIVLCVGSLWGWNLAMRGKISTASSNSVIFTSSDGSTVLVLRLDLPDLVFEYGEPQDWAAAMLPSMPKLVLDAAGLIVGLPLRFSPSDLESGLRMPFREKLCFVEIPESTEWA